MAERWRLTCSCGRGAASPKLTWTRTNLRHARERGVHLVKIESRDDYRRRGIVARLQHPRSI